MRIMSAFYRNNDGNEKKIHLGEMTTHVYTQKLKRKLFCPTENCTARVSFSGGRYPHFRTWKYDQHSKKCPYHFDRIPVNLGRNVTDIVSTEISYNRRQKALHDAYTQMNLSEEEREAIRISRNRHRPKAQSITTRKEQVKGEQLVLFDSKLYEDNLIFRRRNLSKRYVDEIFESDIGQIRLVMGNIASSIEAGNVAEIVVKNNDQVITVVFEESFTADPFNSSYLNKFWAINQVLDQDIVQFTGIGDIRKSTRSKRLELVIHAGTDFKVNNKDMSAVAAQIALDQYRLG
ncbi:hypothetical protein JSQ81_04855 [Sporosarcina sp. Marseille-Q4063]|uniref:hypothetical protein n=1 Tax=Sporosarcina sp. Marseille-Q4063 TaxID=2810514 RepID=UPI001BAFE447|nr:hypothetical protein [Sporosarcina sp. Marseille-Q4063]QUW22910.1 hypothetical protein JSQ81_04855 [Sporosarcina sp. Marseille-Q4063]